MGEAIRAVRRIRLATLACGPPCDRHTRRHRQDGFQDVLTLHNRGLGDLVRRPLLAGDQNGRTNWQRPESSSRALASETASSGWLAP